MITRKRVKYIPPAAKKKKFALPPLLLVAMMLAVLLACLPYARAFIIRTYGLEAEPKSEINVIPAEAFLQNDERWAADTLGMSANRMAGHGCLVCCIASVMKHCGFDTDPGRLNQALQQNGVYTEDGDIIWEKLKALGFRHEYQNDFSAATLEGLLKQGQMPIVKVKYRGSGVFHWLLLTGSSKDDFLALDPLNAAKQPIPLKTHGKVYAYRVVVKK